MMDDDEADNFRRIKLTSEVERAEDMVTRYRGGIDFYRDQIDKYRYLLGRIGERLGEPEGGDHDDR